MIVGDDSHYKLKVDHRDFDTNRNGTIDPSEGRLVVFGGIDSSTGLPLGSRCWHRSATCSHSTTLHALAQELGYEDSEIKDRLDQIFNLNNFDYLNKDPLQGIKRSKSVDDVAIRGELAAYTSHRINGRLNLFTRALKKVFMTLRTIISMTLRSYEHSQITF